MFNDEDMVVTYVAKETRDGEVFSSATLDPVAYSVARRRITLNYAAYVGETADGQGERYVEGFAEDPYQLFVDEPYRRVYELRPAN